MAMQVLPRLRLALKLPMLVAAFAALVGVAMLAVLWPVLESRLTAVAIEQLEAVASSRKQAVVRRLNDIYQETIIEAQRQEAKDSLKRLSEIFKRMSERERNLMREAYTSSSRYPVGAREAVDDAGDGSNYSIIHAEVHPRLRRWAQAAKFYDIMLVNEQGDIVYSMAKEDDFATNLLDGPYSNSGAAEAFRGAMAKVRPGDAAVVDFRPHIPSGPSAHAFFATKIMLEENNQAIGALVVQIPVDRFSEVVVDASGLGDTGEVYIVGTDKVMRAASRFAPDGALRESIDNESSRAALSGVEGFRFDRGHRGADALVVTRAIQFYGLTWGMVVKADTREVFAALREAQMITALVGLAAILMVGGLGWLMARHLVGPIQQLTTAMTGLAAGDLRIDVPYAARADELGDMARALQVFKSEVERAGELATVVKENERRLAEVLNQTPLGVIVQNRDGTVRFANDTALDLLRAKRADLVGRNGTAFIRPADAVKFDDFFTEADRRGSAPERDMEFRRANSDESMILSIAGDTIDYDGEKCLIAFFSDVTDRRKSERAFDVERRKSTALFEGAPDATVIIDGEGKVAMFNRRAEEVFGYQRADILGRHIETLLPERMRKTHVGIRSEYLRNPQARAMGEGRELLALGRDGREFPVEISLSPIAGEKLVAATVRDVTARKKAETELRTYEFTLRHAAMGITLITKAGNFAYSNEHFCRLTGRSEETLRNTAIEDLFEETSVSGWAKRWNAFATSGKAQSFERILLLPDGQGVPCEITARHMQFGASEFVCAFMHDISDRKKAEAELRRVHYALEKAADSVIWALKDGTIAEVNLATATMVGRPIEEIQGHHMEEFAEGMSKENWPLIWEKYAAIGQGMAPAAERVVIRKDGARIPVEVTARHISFGGTEYICAFLRDISDRKRAEQEIVKARDAAEEATRAKSSFLAMMSHEIRTPMNGVMSMAQMLESTDLAEDQRDITRVIRSSADALLTIISDILDFSKIEAGKFDLDNAPFDPVTTLETAAELVAQRAHEKNIRLYTEIDPAIPAKLLGDSNRVRQVVLNLLGNAVKFTEKGNVHLRVRRLVAKSGATTEWLRFEVVDTGIGLTEEQIGKLFQAFQQADVSTSRKFGGTGLGLMISKKITELMGGEIGATSTFGEGSTFWFEVPFPVVDRTLERPPADISDLGVVTIGFDDTGAAIVSRYLAAANVTQVEHAGHHDMEQAIQEMAPRVPMVVALLVVRDSVLAVEAVKRLKELKIATLRIVVAMPRGMLSTISHVKSEGVSVLLPLPLPRRLLWRAMAAAAGRVAAMDDRELRSQMDAEWVPPSIEVAREAGVLILVAEDNKTNQHVIRRILTRQGYAFEMANDGVEALKMYKEGRYGIILSDYHMPNMDGFGLTTEIRELEAGTGRRMPIIALTADAMASTKQHCLDAGMDGFLTKPLDLSLLASTLEKWIPAALKLRQRPKEAPAPATRIEPGTASDASHPSGGFAAFDVSRLEDAFGSFNDDAKELVASFVGELPGRIAEIGTMLTAGNTKGARDIVHALKGSSRSIGGVQLGEVATDIQVLLDDGKLDEARRAYPKLSAAVAALDQAVTALTGKAP